MRAIRVSRPRSPDETWEEAVAGAAWHALVGRAPPELVVYSFTIDEAGRRIRLKAHFDRPRPRKT